MFHDHDRYEPHCGHPMYIFAPSLLSTPRFWIERATRVDMCREALQWSDFEVVPPLPFRPQKVVSVVGEALQSGNARVRRRSLKLLLRMLHLQPTTGVSGALARLDKLPEQERSSLADDFVSMALEAWPGEAGRDIIQWLGRLPEQDLSRQAEKVVANHCSWSYAEVELAMKLFPARAWQKLPERMSRYTVKGGRSFLHCAAEQNDLAVCKALVDHVGVPVRLRDECGREPHQQTTDKGVAGYLQSKINIGATRFGSGDAMREALCDTAEVTEVVWYTSAVPAAPTWSGIKHSFLHVLTKSVQSGGGYLLEKSAPLNNDHDGTYVSFWCGDPEGKATEFRKNCGGVREGVTMKDLIRVAQQVGPYRLSTCNCHDVAMTVFNLSCADHSQEVSSSSLPNWLTARILGPFISGGSESTSSVSASTSRKDSSFSSNAKAGASLPPGFGSALSPEKMNYTLEAAYLSSHVYDDKLIEQSLKIEELDVGHIRVENCFHETLILEPLSRSMHRKIKLMPGDKQDIHISEFGQEICQWNPVGKDLCCKLRYSTFFPTFCSLFSNSLGGVIAFSRLHCCVLFSAATASTQHRVVQKRTTKGSLEVGICPSPRRTLPCLSLNPLCLAQRGLQVGECGPPESMYAQTTPMRSVLTTSVSQC